MKRLVIGIFAAVLAGVATFVALPFSWFMPLFSIGIGAALLSGIAARIDTPEERPENGAADVALSMLNIPAQPLAEVPRGWPLDCFLWSAAYVCTLAASAIVGGALV